MFLFLFEYLLQIFFPASFLIVPEISSVPTVGPQSTLYVTNEYISPDGFRRSASLINGVFPAPVIVATKGDHFKLNVSNFLSDSTMLRGTSIHWHGILQRGSNWADGPVGISQCPISPNHSFLYEFNAIEAGTFWYHSHYGTQYCDGMRGALVVYDPQDPQRTLYDVDDENTVVTIGDWYHYPSPSLETFPKADSTLINGKGRYPKGKPAALSIVNVEYGKRYRLRLISITCDGSYTIFIDKHPFTVIEADGQSVVPVRALDALTIFAGQRYSVVIVANQPIGNYWIRAQRGVVQGNVDPFEGGINSAILRYKGAEEVEPVPIPYIPPNRVLRETELHALIDPEAPGKPEQDGGDVNLHFAITYDEKTKMFLTNGKYFQPPKVPVLLQLLSGTPPEELLPEGSIFTLPRNKTISISMLPGEFDTPHPFHLHGHTFSVVRSANTTDDPAPKYNYRDPVRRDTVNLGKVDSGSNVTIRFRTDNPGPWIFHCHVDWHLERGMAIVFAEAPEEARKEIHPPEEWHYLCPVFDNLPESLTSISTVAIPPPTATTIEPTPFINLL